MFFGFLLQLTNPNASIFKSNIAIKFVMFTVVYTNHLLMANPLMLTNLTFGAGLVKE